MAKIVDQIAIVIGAQSGLGSINTVVRDSTIIANTDDGVVLSANEALGLLIRDETLTLDFERIEDDPQNFTGSFSKLPGSFLRSSVSDFSFDITVKGGGKTVDGTPSAGDYNLPEAIETLLSGFGLVRGTPTTADTPYVIDDPVYLTLKVWRGDTSFTMQDCLVTELSYSNEPGNITIVTATVSAGGITFDNADTFPVSIDYGLQESLPAPVLKGAAASIGAVTRGFLAGTLTLTLDSEEVPDSNSTDGVIDEVTGRTIQWEGDFYVDSTDSDQDWVNLIRTGTFEDLQWTLGVHVVGPAQQVNALQFYMQNVDFTAVKVVEQAGKVVYNLTGYATSPGAGNDEFTLTSK